MYKTIILLNFGESWGPTGPLLLAEASGVQRAFRPLQDDQQGVISTIINKSPTHLICFNKVRINRKLKNLEKKSPENHAEYLKEAVDKVLHILIRYKII